MLALCVCFSFTAVMPQTAQAKTKKLSYSYVRLVKGGAKTITLSSGSGKWSVKDSSIVKLKNKKKKSVRVVAKKKGKTVLVCKSGKKTLKCTVKVITAKKGKVTDNRMPAVIKGKTASLTAQLDDGMKITKTVYDTSRAKVTYKHGKNDTVTLKVKGKKTGSLKLDVYYNTNEMETVTLHIMPGFRGSKSVKNSKKNYKKWRKEWIKCAAKQDMTSWEVIDAVGYLISSGKYGYYGSSNGQNLWYSGKGTCVSGAKMMNDFMKDLGVPSKVRFAGNDGTAVDIYGYTVGFGSGHKNVRIKFGGTYIVNPQPGFPWPYGIIKK